MRDGTLTKTTALQWHHDIRDHRKANLSALCSARNRAGKKD